MANTIELTDNKVYLTSELNCIVISTDAGFADVSLSADGQVLLSERWYAYDGEIRAADLNSLIESEMRRRDIAAMDILISAVTTDGAEAASANISVIYCEKTALPGNAVAFLSDNFMTTLQYKRIPPQTPVSLYYFQKRMIVGASLSVEFVARNADGSLSRAQFDLHNMTAVANGVQYFIILPEEIEEGAASALPGTDWHSIVRFTVIIGNRSATFFIDHSLDKSKYFTFRNCFNVPERAYFNLDTTLKQQISQSEAVVGGVTMLYNRSVNCDYESKTSVLSYEEAFWLQQLLASHKVSVPVPDKYADDDTSVDYDVVITDSDIALSDNAEEPEDIKFNWRFADKRLLLDLPTQSGIFTPHYNEKYK